jgi:UDP-GlcNAc:undecaprenyl-phosphate GlcNAc-1-phosphate transferase
LLAGGLSWITIKLIFSGQAISGGVFLLFVIFLIISLAGSRASFLFLDRIFVRQFRGVEKQNILLYGAGDAGEIALRWILRNPSIGYNVVGFLDDDTLKRGSNINGINILGGTDELVEFVQDRKVSGVIVTTEGFLATSDGERLKNECRNLGIWLRVLKIEFEITE